MRITESIPSPTKVVVTNYRGGLVIDCTSPFEASDIDGIRRQFSLGALGDEALLEAVNEFLMRLQLTQAPSDFEHGVFEFTGESNLPAAVESAVEKLNHHDEEIPATLAARVLFILEHTGLLREPDHLPTRLYCHIPGETSELPDDGTHFGYVMDGDDSHAQLESGERYPLYPNSYFCIPGKVDITGSGSILVVTRINYAGNLVIGGKIPAWGCLQYIDGCTDSILVPPPKLGAPCFNALYFPPATKQTRHYHPSIRTGMVIGGEGFCVTPDGRIPLRAGNVFLLPPETWHAFETSGKPISGRSALTVAAFHPDSDFGPTDDDHPMINRTYSEYLHRLTSAAKVG